MQEVQKKKPQMISLGFLKVRGNTLRALSERKDKGKAREERDSHLLYYINTQGLSRYS